MAARHDLIVDQGTTWSTVLNSSVDLDGFVGSAQARRYYDSKAYIEFDVVVGANTVMLSLTPEKTSNVGPGRYVYDVELVSNTGDVYRFVEGDLTILPEVTKTVISED